MKKRNKHCVFENQSAKDTEQWLEYFIKYTLGSEIVPSIPLMDHRQLYIISTPEKAEDLTVKTPPVDKQTQADVLSNALDNTTSVLLFKPAENKPSTEEEIFLQGCSSDVKAYIRILQARQPHSEIVKESKLTPDEIKQLSIYYDHSTQKVIDRPVMVNGKGPYELSNIIQGRDAQGNCFQPNSITPCWSLINTFTNDINKIIQNRQTTLRIHV